MPKRTRVDDASQDLIDSLRDQDDIEHALKGFEDERAAIGVAFSDIVEKLRYIKTTDPSRLSKRNRLRFDQKMEYEQGLRDDRLQELGRRIDAYRQAHRERVGQRKKRRVEERTARELDDKILECQTLAQHNCKDAHWKTIGKNKHIQQALNSKLSTMTEEQKAQYATVLQELKEKGWRVLEQHKETI
jgi:hypothetical protein